ncbi:uncharacterized protein B0J16DRAFT_288396 [Fusarium flagelliforme]|uniref:uncharacterized protein n=1 Tax=Fusarium flagelliforme TaxID=2675880 RepID=UPI001E8C9E14
MGRSRGGCGNCKRRHRKCDQTRPHCRSCEALDVECDGYNRPLRWDVGTAYQRHLTSRPTPARSTSYLTTADVPPTSPVYSPQGPFYNSSPPQDTNMGEGSETSVLEAPELTSRQRQQEIHLENIYLLYSTRRDDDLPAQIAEISRQSPVLTLIIAAMHLYLNDPSDVSLPFQPYQARGLALFRRQLDTYSGSLDVGVLCAGIFICTLHLFQGAPWSFLLEHMMNVYKIPHRLFNQTLRSIQPIARFLVECMGVLDMPTFVRGRSTVTNGIWAQLRAAERAHGADAFLGGIETMSGLPRSLLDIFAAIQQHDAESRFLDWQGEVGEVPATHLWEAYRCAGVLTARRSKTVETGPSSVDPRVSAEVLLSRLIAALDALCETRRRPEYSASLACNSLLYPLVAARLEVALLRRHTIWLDTLRHIYRQCQPYRDTANVGHVMEILDEALEKNDDSCDMDEQARRRQVELALF